MKIHTISLLVLTAIVIMTPLKSNSQTCKIKSCSVSKGETVYTEVYEYDYVEEKPEFPGGRCSMINYINSTRKYPVSAYETGIEGRVTCSFVVDSDGKVCHVQVLKGVEPSLNQEAIRVVSAMPDWTPGKIANKNVPTRVVCCIPFRK